MEALSGTTGQAFMAERVAGQRVREHTGSAIQYPGPHRASAALRVAVLKPTTIPEFTGSAWRGAFGHALRQISCQTGAKLCDGCPKLYDCAYQSIFVAPIPKDSKRLRRYPQASPPFVLNVPLTPAGSLRAGDELEIGITLFGRHSQSLPLVTAALSSAAPEVRDAQGNPGAFRLISVNTAPESEKPPPATPTREITIELLTPTQIHRDNRAISPDELQFSDLFGSALRRLSIISYFHQGLEIQTDFKALMDAARGIPITHRELRRFESRSHSQRSQQRYPIKALLGTFRCDLSQAPDLWPWLWWGQVVHAGKLPVKGLGRYRLEPPNFSPNRRHSRTLLTLKSSKRTSQSQ